MRKWGRTRRSPLGSGGFGPALCCAGMLIFFPRRASRKPFSGGFGIGLLLALGLDRRGDGGLGELHLGVLVDLEDDGLFLYGVHGCVDSAGGDDLVAFLDRLDHPLGFLLLLVLRPDDKEVENDEDETKGDDGGDHRSGRIAGPRGLEQGEP